MLAHEPSPHEYTQQPSHIASMHTTLSQHPTLLFHDCRIVHRFDRLLLECRVYDHNAVFTIIDSSHVLPSPGVHVTPTAHVMCCQARRQLLEHQSERKHKSEAVATRKCQCVSSCDYPLQLSFEVLHPNCCLYLHSTATTNHCNLS